jgi:hypothetical protein
LGRQVYITSFNIPEGVSSIAASAFNGCTKLTSITLPNSLTSIGDYAFVACSNLVNITIPDSVNSIGYYAFNGCDSLKNINFEDTSTWYHTTSNSSYGGTSVSLTDPSTNVSYFVKYYVGSTYYSGHWYKK